MGHDEENTTPGLAVAPPAPPRYFLLVGWSWLIFGLLGLLLGVVHIPSFYYLDQMRVFLRQSPFDSYPLIAEQLAKGIDWIVPLTLCQIGLSLIMSWLAWFFLQGKNWARLGLSLINLLTFVLLIWGVWLADRALGTLWLSFGMSELVQAGVVTNIPLTMRLILLGTAILGAASLIWMGWYLHHRDLKEYCARAGVRPH